MATFDHFEQKQFMRLFQDFMDQAKKTKNNLDADPAFNAMKQQKDSLDIAFSLLKEDRGYLDAAYRELIKQEDYFKMEDARERFQSEASLMVEETMSMIDEFSKAATRLHLKTTELRYDDNGIPAAVVGKGTPLQLNKNFARVQEVEALKKIQKAMVNMVDGPDSGMELEQPENTMTIHQPDKRPAFIPSTSVRRGRAFRPLQKQVMQEMLPPLQVTINAQGAIENLPSHRALHLEIGFGKGEHLRHQAALQPEVTFIGAELYRHGVVTCAREIAAQNLTNIRLFTDDARVLLQALPDHSLDKVYLLFPDPWPKVKHHRRRIVHSVLLDMLAQKIKSGGLLQLATDHPEYRAWMMVQMHHAPQFRFLATCKQDWLTPPQGYTQTRYEEKAKAGYPTYMAFERV